MDKPQIDKIYINNLDDERFNKLRERYKSWKINSLNKELYFIIFESFSDELLSEISGGALKLYVFLGLKSDHYYGYSWFSIKKLADYFKVSERTVSTWIKELIELKLIERVVLDEYAFSLTVLKPY